VPIQKFRELGVLDALLKLTESAAGTPAPQQRDDETELIATMDVDDLVARALGGTHRN